MNEILFNVMLVAIGWLNGLFLGWFILGKKKQIRIEDSVGKNLGQVPPQRNPPPPLIPTSWVLPPHYFPTIKKKLQMKPFDLEAAKRGEPIVTRDGRDVKFIAHVPDFAEFHKVLIAVSDCQQVISTSEAGSYSLSGTSYFDIFMAPKKQTVWVNLYETDTHPRYQFATKKEADEYDRRGLNRIGDKAYPVEIEA